MRRRGCSVDQVEQSFIATLERLTEKRGIKFEGMIRKALPQVMGETPAQVFMMMMGRKSMTGPKEFVKEVRKMMGAGTGPLCASLTITCELQRQQAAQEDGHSVLKSLAEEINQVESVEPRESDWPSGDGGSTSHLSDIDIE
jgi:hypothetical protein